ncbi:CDP-alcohol phosphatidyltransferase family protein [Candidatus Woesearchaeota archaeon]|nr:CDP-alcohol phosphatidyltransferase family protein [Candidatus Woesearchaeota archaeon]
MDIVQTFRVYRSKKLEKLAKAVSSFGINANHITILSLLSGIAAIYFLFNNYYLFVVFALLHLLFDGVDGVVARVTKPTTQGKYFDLLSDSGVTFLALLKVAWHLQELYAYIAAGLFLAALLIHLRSKLQTPMLFLRTISIVVLLMATHPLFLYTKILLTAGYLAAGGTSLYSLARQLQWRMQHG